MLTRTQKETQVEELRQKFGRATSLFVADYRGLNVKQQNALRDRLREQADGEAEYRVTKNTLLRRAVEGTPVSEIAEHFQGPTAVTLSYGDPARIAKALVGYAKEHEAFEVRAAWVEGRTLGREEIATLATLPTLEELRARLLGLITAPATKLVRVLNAPAEQLARVMEARRANLAGE